MSQTTENPKTQYRTDGAGRQIATKKGGSATTGGRGPGMLKWLPSKNLLKPNNETNPSAYKRKVDRKSFALTGSRITKV